MATKSNSDHGAERDDLRTGILLMLADEPFSSQEMINEAIERSNGHWRLTSAKVHPMLDQLTDEGLIQLSEEGGGGRQRPYELTSMGQEYVNTNFANATPPWLAYAPYVFQPGQGQSPVSDGVTEQFQEVAAQFNAAANQVAQAGTREQQERARKLLVEGKRGLYRILAEEDESLNQA